MDWKSSASRSPSRAASPFSSASSKARCSARMSSPTHPILPEDHPKPDDEGTDPPGYGGFVRYRYFCPYFMIAKTLFFPETFCTYAMQSLRADKSLRDHARCPCSLMY